MNFNGKTILITGASSGIGAAFASSLSNQAATLILVARRQDELNKLANKLMATNSKLSVVVMAKDITLLENQVAIREELTTQGTVIDILINNAGVGDEHVFHQSNWQQLETIINLNVKSVVSFTHLLMDHFIDQPKGKGIVFIGSGGGIAWMAGSAVYSASKHFITALAMILRAELKPYGVEVALACPGPVDTEFDQRAGIKDGMKGGPSQSTRISAEECVTDIITSLKKGRNVVFPGKKLNLLMRFYLLLPWFARVKLLEGEGKKLYINTDK